MCCAFLQEREDETEKLIRAVQMLQEDRAGVSAARQHLETTLNERDATLTEITQKVFLNVHL